MRKPIRSRVLLTGLTLFPFLASAVGLPVTYFDFLGEGAPSTGGRVVHPDFDLAPREGPTPGLVQPLLSGSVPGFQSTGGLPLDRPQLTTPENLAAWYVPDSAFNLEIPSVLNATRVPTGRPGLQQLQFHYPDGFFPLDGQGLGDFGDTGHNHHFTMTFLWKTVYFASYPNRFEFAADDDLLVFINGKLWVDLGGIHPVGSPTGVFDLNEAAPALGLVDRRRYTFQLFYAERHTGQAGLVASLPIYSPPVPEPTPGLPAAAVCALGGLLAFRERCRRYRE